MSEGYLFGAPVELTLASGPYPSTSDRTVPGVVVMEGDYRKLEGAVIGAALAYREAVIMHFKAADVFDEVEEPTEEDARVLRVARTRKLNRREELNQAIEALGRAMKK